MSIPPIWVQAHSWVHKNRKCGSKHGYTTVEACEMEPKGSLKVPCGRNFQWFLSETQLGLIPERKHIRSRGPSPAGDPDLPAYRRNKNVRRRHRRASGHRHKGSCSGTSEDPRAGGFLVCLTFPAVAPHADAPYFSLFWPVPE